MPRNVNDNTTAGTVVPSDLAGYATDSELAAAVATREPEGDYVTTAVLVDSHDELAAELYSALDGKQPSGDYATNSTVTTGLAGKQATLTASTDISVGAVTSSKAVTFNTPTGTHLFTSGTANNVVQVSSTNAAGYAAIWLQTTAGAAFIGLGGPSAPAPLNNAIYVTGGNAQPFVVASAIPYTRVLGTTDATSTTTGSLQTLGGLAAVKNGYFGGNVYAEGSKQVATREWVQASGVATNANLTALSQIEPYLPYYLRVGPYPTNISRIYPPTGLSGGTTTLSGQTHGNFTYVVNHSSWQGGFESWRAYNPAPANLAGNGTTWRSAAGRYDGVTGAYTGSVTSTLTNGTVVNGEFIDFSIGAGNHMKFLTFKFTQASPATRPSRLVFVAGGRPGQNSFDLIADVVPTYDGNGQATATLGIGDRLLDNMRMHIASMAGTTGGTDTYASFASAQWLLGEPNAICGNVAFTGAENHFVNLPTVGVVNDLLATRSWVQNTIPSSAAYRIYVSTLAKGSDAITVNQISPSGNEYTFTPLSAAVRSRSHYIFHVSVVCYSTVDLYTGYVRCILKDATAGASSDYVVDQYTYFQSQYQRQCVSWTWTTQGLNSTYDAVGYFTNLRKVTILVPAANMAMDRINITVQEIPI